MQSDEDGIVGPLLVWVSFMLLLVGGAMLWKSVTSL